jgi:hypothetical protein
MDSEKLSARVKQPGHDRTFERSESLFISLATQLLDPALYEVVDKPKELRNLFGPRSGVAPEATVVSKRTGRRFFVEVKKQGDRGNAEERACKHHTVQFYKCLHDRFGYDYHPYVTIFCESLAVNPRYTEKAVHYYEPGQYVLWVDYDMVILKEFLDSKCREWLDPPPS